MLIEKFYIIAGLGHVATLWILILLSVLSIGFILERFWFYKKLAKESEAIRETLQKSLMDDSHTEIQDFANKSDGYEATALKYGFRHLSKSGSEGLEEVFSSYILSVKPDLDRFLNMLATIGSNAPFIGLLGTVFGIMEAFKALAVSEGNPSVVMSGISQALLATAIGLLVAIPATIFYNHFQKKSKTITNNILNLKDICIVYKSRWNK